MIAHEGKIGKNHLLKRYMKILMANILNEQLNGTATLVLVA